MISSHPTMLVWTPIAGDGCEGIFEAASNHAMSNGELPCLPPLCEVALTIQEIF
jgi:hypothetical protein